MHGFVNPPAQQHKERHPKQRELDAVIDRTALRECVRLDLLQLHDMAEDPVKEIHHGDATVCCERHNGKQDEAEPSRYTRETLPDIERRSAAHSSWIPPDSRTSSMLSTS